MAMRLRLKFCYFQTIKLSYLYYYCDFSSFMDFSHSSNQNMKNKRNNFRVT